MRLPLARPPLFLRHTRLCRGGPAKKRGTFLPSSPPPAVVSSFFFLSSTELWRVSSFFQTTFLSFSLPPAAVSSSFLPRQQCGFFLLRRLRRWFLPSSFFEPPPLRGTRAEDQLIAFYLMTPRAYPFYSYYLLPVCLSHFSKDPSNDIPEVTISCVHCLALLIPSISPPSTQCFRPAIYTIRSPRC